MSITLRWVNSRYVGQPGAASKKEPVEAYQVLPAKTGMDMSLGRVSGT